MKWIYLIVVILIFKNSFEYAIISKVSSTQTIFNIYDNYGSIVKTDTVDSTTATATVVGVNSDGILSYTLTGSVTPNEIYVGLSTETVLSVNSDPIENEIVVTYSNGKTSKLRNFSFDRNSSLTLAKPDPEVVKVTAKKNGINTSVKVPCGLDIDGNTSTFNYFFRHRWNYQQITMIGYDDDTNTSRDYSFKYEIIWSEIPITPKAKDNADDSCGSSYWYSITRDRFGNSDFNNNNCSENNKYKGYIPGINGESAKPYVLWAGSTSTISCNGDGRAIEPFTVRISFHRCEENAKSRVDLLRSISFFDSTAVSAIDHKGKSIMQLRKYAYGTALVLGRFTIRDVLAGDMDFYDTVCD